MLQHLKSVLSGDMGLARTFWVYFAIPYWLIYCLDIFIFSEAYALTIVDIAPALLKFCLFLLVLLQLLVAYVGGYAVIKCIQMRSKIGVKGALAGLTIAYVMVQLPIAHYVNYNDESQFSQSEFELTIAMLNRDLPMRIDDKNTLIKISYENRFVVYHHSLDFAFADDIDFVSFKQESMEFNCKRIADYINPIGFQGIEERYIFTKPVRTLRSVFFKSTDCP